MLQYLTSDFSLGAPVLILLHFHNIGVLLLPNPPLPTSHATKTKRCASYTGTNYEKLQNPKYYFKIY